MSYLEPINQTKLYGLEKYFTELVRFYKNGNYPNKILFSGQKGIGKATLAFHFINYILTILEEPNENINFILIHNNRKILSTLLSRCINFKISLSNNDYLKISNQLLNNDLNNLVSNELINYYFTPGEIYQLVQFSSENDYDLSNIDLKNFLKILINDTQYKKNNFINNMMYSLMEFYFRKSNQSFSKLLNEKYSYFIKRISDTKTYNLDKESLFMEFNEEILDAY